MHYNMWYSRGRIALIIDLDSSDGVLWETDPYPWSTAGQNPVIKMASKMAAITGVVC